MAAASVEERLAQLEQQNSIQQKRIEQLEAIAACTNITMTYEYFLSGGLMEDVVSLFAMKTPDVRASLGPLGTWQGPDSIRKCYVGLHKMMLGDQNSAEGRPPGLLPLSIRGNLAIEVAEDGQTAKALLMAPGANAVPGIVDPIWFWEKCAYDFIKENGEWKIWHYRLHGLFAAPFPALLDTSAAEKMREAYKVMPIPPEFAPDSPGQDFWLYGPNEQMEYVPVPRPYKSFDQTFSY